jgi:hypothetical protein
VSQKPGRRAAFSIYRVEDGRIERELRVWNGSAFEPLAS